MMIFRLLFIACVCMLGARSNAQVCTPNMTPKQAFLMITNRGTTTPSANPLATLPKLININKASEAELTQLEGIGAKKAQQIILYRQVIAAFATADDLANVKGIGKAIVDKNRQRITTQ